MAKACDFAAGETVPTDKKIMPKTTPEQVAALKSFTTSDLMACCIKAGEVVPLTPTDGVKTRALISQSSKLKTGSLRSALPNARRTHHVQGHDAKRVRQRVKVTEERVLSFLESTGLAFQREVTVWVDRSQSNTQESIAW